MEKLRAFLKALKASAPWRYLLKIQRVILFLSTSVMVGILGIVVFRRYAMHTDFFGYDEIVMISAFWMYFIGSSYSMERREHVRADILERMLPPKGKRALRLLGGFIQLLIALETANLSIKYIINGIKVNPTTSAWQIPMLTSMTAVTIGFVLMVFYVIVHFLDEITGDVPEPASEGGAA